MILNVLKVAYEYNLDTDLVYQRRWETSEFDQNAIEDFLRKITKRSYINEQVLNRIPVMVQNSAQDNAQTVPISCTDLMLNQTQAF